MAENDMTLTMRIKSVFDGAGSKEAAAATEDLAKKANDAGKSAKGLSDNTSKMGQSVGKAAELTGNLSNALGHGGKEAQQMGAAMRVLNAVLQGSSGGLMGLATLAIGAGVAAWVSYQNKVAEAKKKLEDFRNQMVQNKMAQDRLDIEKMAGQYDVLRKAIDDASDAQSRLNTAQAAADNADKAARLAEADLREKEETNKLKPGDDLGRAKITAKYSAERRRIETEYAIKNAEREAFASAQKYEDSQRKKTLTDADVKNARDKMDQIKKEIRTINEQIGALYGASAPMREEVTTMAGPQGIPVVTSRKTVVDTEKQAKQVAELQKLLVAERDKETRLPTKGKEADYMEAAKIMAAAIDRAAKEQVEVEVSKINAQTAVKKYDTANQYMPALNAADAATDKKSIDALNTQKNLELLNGRMDRVLQMAQNNAAVKQQAAAEIDAAPFKRFGGQTYHDAKNLDQKRDREAAEAKQLLASLTAMKAGIEKLPFDQMTRVVNQINSRLERFESALNNMPFQN